jgi:hypothetical protein
VSILDVTRSKRCKEAFRADAEIDACLAMQL